MADFTFIILTYNEEQHLPRLLESIKELHATTYVLDSGSTDNTLNICDSYNVKHQFHAFENHPKQWHHALSLFKTTTPWIIGLDADQIVTEELFSLLANFRDQDFSDIDGIYFNRKNYFKGRWIRYGGYYPVYLLKMFRNRVGYSDLNENMDHKFIVPGKTIVWKRGHLIEENLKENEISFWISKHNGYSDLLSDEESERIDNQRVQLTPARIWGSPNEQNAWSKRLWWKLPRYVRPFLYFGYRFIFRLGFLDGKTGILFHFLQAFWFRLLVDVKIEERLLKAKQNNMTEMN